MKKYLENTGHQAFLLEGATEESVYLLIRYLSCEKKAFCKKCKVCKVENLFEVKKFEDDFLKIENAREIQAAAGQSSFSEAPKIFIIKSRYIAEDVQATLLKTLEEPHPNNFFIFSGIQKEALSRPLLSRLAFLLQIQDDEESETSSYKFSENDIQSASKDRAASEDIFRKLEFWADMMLKNSSQEKLKDLALFIDDLYEMKGRFFEKTYSSKMLLEHLINSKNYIGS